MQFHFTVDAEANGSHILLGFFLIFIISFTILLGKFIHLSNKIK